MGWRIVYSGGGSLFYEGGEKNAETAFNHDVDVTKELFFFPRDAFPFPPVGLSDGAAGASALRRASVGQENPLGQVRRVSDPLGGYGIPSAAAHSVSAPGKTLTVLPEPGACQAREAE